MLGIEDGWVLAGYLLCIASAAGCALYGALNWSRDDDAADGASAPVGDAGHLIQ